MVSQNFDTRVSAEDVLLSNDAIFKCSVPSFVSDFVEIEAWVDSEGAPFYPHGTYGNPTRDQHHIFSLELT